MRGRGLRTGLTYGARFCPLQKPKANTLLKSALCYLLKNFSIRVYSQTTLSTWVHGVGLTRTFLNSMELSGTKRTFETMKKQV